MSYLIMSVDPDTEYYTLNELIACRVCLATNTKLFDLHELGLTQMFGDLTGTPVSTTDGLPQHICAICYTLLRKSAAFRSKCRQTHIFLQDARIKQPMITTEYISDIRGALPDSAYKLFKTDTLVIEFPPEGQCEDNKPEEPVVIYSDTDNDEHEELISPAAEEHHMSSKTEYNHKLVRLKRKINNTDGPSPLKTDRKHNMSSREKCTHEYIFQGSFKSLSKPECNEETFKTINDHVNLNLIQDPLDGQEYIIDNPSDLQEFTVVTPENTNDEYDEIVLITDKNDDELTNDTNVLHEEFIVKEESY